MSQEFLPKILKEKAREVAVMKEEELSATEGMLLLLLHCL